MRNPTDTVTITIGAIFSSGKISKEEIKEFVENKITELKGASLNNCEINDKNLIEMIISIPKSVFESQGPNNAKEIEEFISFFGPMFLMSEKMPVKIKSVKAEFSS